MKLCQNTNLLTYTLEATLIHPESPWAVAEVGADSIYAGGTRAYITLVRSRRTLVHIVTTPVTQQDEPLRANTLERADVVDTAMGADVLVANFALVLVRAGFEVGVAGVAGGAGAGVGAWRVPAEMAELALVSAFRTFVDVWDYT